MTTSDTKIAECWRVSTEHVRARFVEMAGDGR